MTLYQTKFKKTEDIIIKALLEVGSTKSLAKISISDISRVSGLSRGTFYLHFIDKDDLVKHINEEFLNAFQEILDNQMNGTMSYQKLSTNKPYPVIISLVRLIANNRKLLAFLLGSNGDPKFLTAITAKLQTAILKELESVKGVPKFRTDIPNEYAIKLVINAILTIITTWLESKEDRMSQFNVSMLIMKALYLSPYDMLGIKDT
ncbi:MULTISPECIES: TetR/AcrR family transcriptional regulator [Liquorilactobacillus]|uniref:TetR/AcrR family transcriptional regulator n=1 Tax=Liquorilactobacillus TaxID=2767888 RepID=UPI0021C47D41|nr:TetR/AcrR family transcriptional regulator [Liquorilactobacillus satsumensis]MCP9328680.1 TetR/AcrR family transcriptional regulator [Liquorilactobacillus satsumensis]